MGCGVDFMDSDKYVLYIGSSGLSLGDSDAYTNPSEFDKKKKVALSKYYTKLLTIAGYTEEQAASKVDDMYKFESMIAPYIKGDSEYSKDDEKFKNMYNVMTADELDKMAPNLKIKEYLKNGKVDNADKIILQEPKWLQGLNIRNQIL